MDVTDAEEEAGPMTIPGGLVATWANMIQPVRPSTPIPPAITPSDYYFECKVCPSSFQSRYALQCHMNKHVTCRQCGCEFRTVHELSHHRDYCSRRFGITVCPRPATRASTVPDVRRQPTNLPHHCPLCHRRYETGAKLRNHQIFRCRKRYVAPGWCVKI